MLGVWVQKTKEEDATLTLTDSRQPQLYYAHTNWMKKPDFDFTCPANDVQTKVNKQVIICDASFREM